MMNMEQYHDKVTENIREHGRHVVGVFPTGKDADVNEAFEYTIGNFRKDLPELLLVGIYDVPFVLNRLSEIMIERGKPFEDGEMVSLGEGARYPLYVIEASDDVKENFTIQAGQHFGHENYRVMQVIMPDTKGRFPWQRGCSKPYADVTVHRRKHS